MKRFKNFMSNFFSRFSEDDIFTMSGALSYYSALAISPVAILMISLMGLLSLDMQSSLITQTEGLLGAQAAEVLNTVIQGAESQPNLASISGWIGAIVLLISASVVFLQLHSSMNTIFDADKIEKPPQSMRGSIIGVVKDRLLSIGMLLSFVFLTIISLALSTALAFIFDSSNLAIGVLLSSVINLIIFGVVFAAMFRWVSDRRPPFKYCLIGGAITAVLFIIGKNLIGLYIGQAAVGTAYGAAGSLIALLVWIYYASLIVFLGGEITATLFLPAKITKKELEEVVLREGLEDQVEGDLGKDSSQDFDRRPGKRRRNRRRNFRPARQT